jgi:CheY-like chemotaxis protein
LQGVTILAVEDSRFACEALRLIARRAGARLRRAETMAAARDHLRVYRPDVVLIDLGLPDGRGDALIRDLAQGPRRPSVVPAGQRMHLASLLVRLPLVVHRLHPLQLVHAPMLVAGHCQ